VYLRLLEITYGYALNNICIGWSDFSSDFVTLLHLLSLLSSPASPLLRVVVFRSYALERTVLGQRILRLYARIFVVLQEVSHKITWVNLLFH
jgi:hypothetical protein